MAGSLLRKNDVTASLDYAKRSVALRQSLASASPRDRDAQKDLADAYRILGQIFEQTQIWAAAIDSYQKGLPILESLAAQMPADGELKRMRMIAYAELGDMQFIADAHAKHRNPEAIANLRRIPPTRRRCAQLGGRAAVAREIQLIREPLATWLRLPSVWEVRSTVWAIAPKEAGLLQRAVDAASQVRSSATRRAEKTG